MKKGFFAAIIGAGIGAAVVIFSSRENRKKAVKAYSDFLSSADDTISGITETIESTTAINKNTTNGMRKFKDLLN